MSNRRYLLTASGAMAILPQSRADAEEGISLYLHGLVWNRRGIPNESEKLTMQIRSLHCKTATSLWTTAIPVILALAASAAPAWSGVLPPATTVTICSQAGTSVSDPVACSVGGASASVILSPFAGLQAGATGFGVSNGSLAQLKYGFEVLGGNPGDQVPVDILFDLRTAASVDGLDATFGVVAGAEADLNVLNQGQSIFFKCASTARFPTDLCGVSSFSGSGSITAISGDTSNQLQLRVVAGTGPDSFPDSLAAFAFADPLIFVDPGFAGASQYSIVLTSGVGNGIASPVPEPAEGLLAAAGMLAILGRRAIGARSRLGRSSR